MTPEDTNRNPVHLEFFRNEALSNPVDAIVREDIQNRLDAKSKSAGEDPIIIKAYFPDKEEYVLKKKDFYLKNLIGHTKANLHELKDIPSDDRPLSFVVIEDFNTRGLQGDRKERMILTQRRILKPEMIFIGSSEIRGMDRKRCR